MSLHSEGARHGHPVMIFFVVVIFLIMVVWFGSSVAPGGASHTHTVPCDASNPGPGFPACPGNDTNTSYYDLAGGTSDNFNSFYNNFTVLGSGLLVFIALLGGVVIWMFRGKQHA